MTATLLGDIPANKSMAVGILSVQAKRVSTGALLAGITTLITVTWDTPFADANYTCALTIKDSTGSSLALSIIHIETQTASAITVRILNSALITITGELHAVAVPD